MNSKFLTAIENRRSRYALSSKITISDERIQEIIETSVKHSPSAFNCQSSRVVLLKNTEHQAFWNIVLDELRAKVPPQAFEKTKDKVNSFAAAYATILFFEEQKTIETLQTKFPTYSASFPAWSEQGSGILQFIIWTALEEEGLGANLQHYNPLIDEKVKAKWNLPKSWKLIAQMPLGNPIAPANDKTYMPIDERIKIFD